MAESKLNDIIGTSLEKIKALADGETVIGKPITTPDGTTVIPVSKISMGFASGGIDYNGKKTAENTKQNFGGGGGTGITVAPVAFLIISSDGNIQLLPISGPSQAGAVDTVDKVTSFIERSPDILERIKRVFTSDKKKKKQEAEDAGVEVTKDLTEAALDGEAEE
ncbi:MAG: sporulation protein YtfJ [Clostridia bacterium]|nr:sporulation protein YtfJ [Clostridia bacterium]